MDVFLSVFQVLIPLGIIAVWCFLIFMFVKTASKKLADKRAPEEQANGTVASKRVEVSGGEHTSTSYYVTVEFEDGSRREFSASGALYGILAEGDTGIATTKGSTIVGFARRKIDAHKEDDGWHRCPACNAVFKGDTCDYCGTPWMGDK